MGEATLGMPTEEMRILRVGKNAHNIRGKKRRILCMGFTWELRGTWDMQLFALYMSICCCNAIYSLKHSFISSHCSYNALITTIKEHTAPLQTMGLCALLYLKMRCIVPCTNGVEMHVHSRLSLSLSHSLYIYIYIYIYIYGVYLFLGSMIYHRYTCIVQISYLSYSSDHFIYRPRHQCSLIFRRKLLYNC